MIDDAKALDSMSDWLTTPTSNGSWGSACDFIEMAASLIKATGRDTDPGCIECEATGWLLDQSYGCAEIPAGWTPVQRCDQCSKYGHDESAVLAAAVALGATGWGYFFPSEPGNHDRDEPGDYAIRLKENQ